MYVACACFWKLPAASDLRIRDQYVLADGGSAERIIPGWKHLIASRTGETPVNTGSVVLYNRRKMHRQLEFYKTQERAIAFNPTELTTNLPQKELINTGSNLKVKTFKKLREKMLGHLGAGSAEANHAMMYDAKKNMLSLKKGRRDCELTFSTVL